MFQTQGKAFKELQNETGNEQKERNNGGLMNITIKKNNRNML